MIQWVLLAALIYSYQDIMEGMGLVSRDQSCLNAKTRLKNACCNHELTFAYFSKVGTASAPFRIKKYHVDHCIHSINPYVAGGCHPDALLTNEEYEKGLEALWSNGACAKI